METKRAIIGTKIGRLTIIDTYCDSRRRRIHKCICDCGNAHTVQSSKLLSGHTKSCGCFRQEVITKHGCAGDANPTNAYRSWLGMKQRCLNPNSASWENYGGRGIKICDRWMSFANFLEDMGEPSGIDITIERIDVNGHYCPSNCVWTSKSKQCLNKRNNIRVTLNGETKVLSEWCKCIGIKFNTVLCRIRRGWAAERALTEPIGEWRNRPNKNENNQQQTS